MKQRLLVADADFATSALDSAYFSDAGYCVDTAADGLDCLSKLRRTVPDLLVLDQRLLWGGNEGVLACLRAEYQDGRFLVVLRAALVPLGAFFEWLSAPVVRWLQKPFPIGVLSDCIDSALGGSRNVPGRRPTKGSGLAADGVQQRRRTPS